MPTGAGSLIVTTNDSQLKIPQFWPFKSPQIPLSLASGPGIHKPLKAYCGNGFGFSGANEPTVFLSCQPPVVAVQGNRAITPW